MRKRRFVIVAALLALAQPARAESAPPSLRTPDATVLALDAGELVLDIGAARGVKEGQRVELWRPLKLKHPVTGQVLADRFRIGTVRLVQVQAHLSLGRIEGELARAPAVGDTILVPEAPKPVAPAPAATTTTSAQLPAPAGQKATPYDAPTKETQVVIEDPEGRALADLVASLHGQGPAARADAYAKFLETHPNSRFAAALREEIEALRRLAKQVAPFERSEPALSRLKPGTAQEYAVELDARFTGAVVHVRRRGATAYRSIPMKSIGARYWAATLPGDAIGEPGMEYFAEGVTAEGRAVEIIGSATQPRDVVVDPRPVTGKNPDTLAQVALQSEYASFNTKKANDWLFQTEGSFAWRLRDEGVRAVRSGFGVLRGKGGSLRDLDELGRDPSNVGLTYGYLEAEIAPTSTFALIGRPILGLRERGVAGGAQGFFRVGNDLRTNLVVGGEVLGGVGLRGIVQLEWKTLPRVPITFRTEVTNQPAGEGSDVGARAIVQVGYQFVKDLTVAARGSYQGRTINHAGPGAGLAVSYQW